MAMTAAELATVKRYLGVYACEFDNARLNMLYDESVASDATNPVFGAVALGFYQLALDAVGLTDFRQGETQEKESIIYDRLWRLYLRWNSSAGFPEPLPIFNLQAIRLNYIDFPDEIEA